MISLGVSLHRDVGTFCTPVRRSGKLGEFVVVRREKRAGARVLLQMLDDSPSDRETVKRRGAPANFIE